MRGKGVICLLSKVGKKGCCDFVDEGQFKVCLSGCWLTFSCLYPSLIPVISSRNLPPPVHRRDYLTVTWLTFSVWKFFFSKAHLSTWKMAGSIFALCSDCSRLLSSQGAKTMSTVCQSTKEQLVAAVVCLSDVEDYSLSGHKRKSRCCLHSTGRYFSNSVSPRFSAPTSFESPKDFSEPSSFSSTHRYHYHSHSSQGFSLRWPVKTWKMFSSPVIWSEKIVGW